MSYNLVQRTGAADTRVSPVTAASKQELVKLGKEWLENSPPATRKPPSNLFGWEGPVGFVCHSCAGRLMGRGVDFKQLADDPVWKDDGRSCDLCGE